MWSCVWYNERMNAYQDRPAQTRSSRAARTPAPRGCHWLASAVFFNPLHNRMATVIPIQVVPHRHGQGGTSGALASQWHQLAPGRSQTRPARAICARMRAGRAFSTKNKGLRRVFASQRKSPNDASAVAATSYEIRAGPALRAARKKMRISATGSIRTGRRAISHANPNSHEFGYPKNCA
jgi:hypothetical protein